MQRENVEADMHTGRTPYEDKGRSQVTLLQAKVRQRLPAKQQQQEERPGPDSFLLLQKHSTQPTPWSQTSSFHNCKTIPFCGVSHPVCGPVRAALGIYHSTCPESRSPGCRHMLPLPILEPQPTQAEKPPLTSALEELTNLLSAE